MDGTGLTSALKRPHQTLMTEKSIPTKVLKSSSRKTTCIIELLLQSESFDLDAALAANIARVQPTTVASNCHESASECQRNYFPSVEWREEEEHLKPSHCKDEEGIDAVDSSTYMQIKKFRICKDLNPAENDYYQNSVVEILQRCDSFLFCSTRERQDSSKHDLST